MFGRISSAYLQPTSLPARVPLKLPRVFHPACCYRSASSAAPNLTFSLCSVLRLSHTHLHELSVCLRTCSLPLAQAPNVSVKAAFTRRVRLRCPIFHLHNHQNGRSSLLIIHLVLNALEKGNYSQQPRPICSVREAGGRASVVSKRSNLHAEVSSSLDKHPRETTRLQNHLSPFIKPSSHQRWRLQEHNRSRLDFPRHNLTYYIDADIFLLRSALSPVMVLWAKYTTSLNPVKCCR